MAETRQLFGRNGIGIFPVQLLRRPVAESALVDAIALVSRERARARGR